MPLWALHCVDEVATASVFIAEILFASIAPVGIVNGNLVAAGNALNLV
jgi:hypothetical protein